MRRLSQSTARVIAYRAHVTVGAWLGATCTEVDAVANFHWFAGLIEGEGSFMAPPPSRPNEPRIEIEMRDRDVIDRVGALLGTKTQRRVRKQFDPPRVLYRVRVGGRRAAQVMRALRPYMSERRRVQIDRALAAYVESKPRKLRGQDESRLNAVGLFPLCTAPMCTGVPEADGRCVTHQTEERAHAA